MRMRKRAPLLLLLALVALTGCRFAERSRRVASDAFASFVLESLLRIQTPLTQGTVQRSASSTPAPPIPTAAPAAPKTPHIEICSRRKLPIEKRVEETLPVVPSRIAGISLIAARETRSCSRSIVIRDVLARPVVIARMNIEARFALAQLPSMPRRYVVVTTDTL